MMKFSTFSRRYRRRLEYCWAMAVCVVFCSQWSGELFEYISSTHASAEQFVATHLWYTLGSAFFFFFFPVAAWQRIFSLGVPRWFGIIWGSVLIGLWGWFFGATTRKPLALALFLIVQLPLIIVPMRPDRTNGADFGAGDPDLDEEKRRVSPISTQSYRSKDGPT